jgi:predicted DNA-binding protein with PD1-like motif
MNAYKKLGWTLLTLMVMGVMACQYKPMKQSDKTYAFRLKPGQDLKLSLDSFVKTNQLEAAWIQTAVGSLTDYHIRFANQPNGTKETGHFEIVSLVGTLSINGSHIHISVSDSTGKTIGGHLLEGNIIYTTAEIVIGSSNQFQFKREEDGTTPWKELQVKELNKEQ